MESFVFAGMEKDGQSRGNRGTMKSGRADASGTAGSRQGRIPDAAISVWKTAGGMIMDTMESLKKKLERLHGRGYKAYKDIAGVYRGAGFQLHIDYVQGDPFASPSRIRAVFPRQKAEIPEEYTSSPWRRIAAEDFLAREAARAIRGRDGRPGGSGKSGLIAVDAPGQQVLARTAVRIARDAVELRLSVGLPAAGRTILGREAAELLCGEVPRIAETAVRRFPRERLERHLRLADRQQAIREYLRGHGYAAFVANGAILPRESGNSDRPLPGGQALPFQSPPSLEIAIPVPHGEPLRGMGIPGGITLIVGGGYHGKSTLLKALERGVYNHIEGDGREYVITDDTAVKIRAEEGRSVTQVNLAPFISGLPFGKDTGSFSTEDASGSTSQAAGIMEALEMGTRLLLMDEDTSATNFLIRDARMQRLVAKGKEPITPFVDKARQLYEEYGVSTILALGGSGDYFSVADRVILMDEYRPRDVTEEAKAISREMENLRAPEGGERFGEITQRSVLPQSFDVLRGRKAKTGAKGIRTVVLGDHEINLAAVEQLVDASQTRTIAEWLRLLGSRLADGRTPLAALAEQLSRLICEEGLDAISPFAGQHPGDLALPRPFELAAAVNRLRGLKVRT